MLKYLSLNKYLVEILISKTLILLDIKIWYTQVIKTVLL